jgi:hypothetical protein
LKSDGEVASGNPMATEYWEMSKSIGFTKVPFLENSIETPIHIIYSNFNVKCAVGEKEKKKNLRRTCGGVRERKK